jgi:hypothetical protein
VKDLNHIQKAFEVADQRGSLIDCLLSMESGTRRIDCGQILCGMHNLEKISLVAGVNLTAIAELEHNDFWMVIRGTSIFNFWP